jgi:hypothetical protein
MVQKNDMNKILQQSCTNIAKNPILHAHTNYIEVHYHFICEKVISTQIELTHVPNIDQLANNENSC